MIKSVKNIKVTGVLIVWLFAASCNSGSPFVEFHSYQELSEYDFIKNDWFPEILNDDATAIQETYDVYTKHLFGSFDFNRRFEYDSIFKSYAVATSDSLFKRLENIEKPRYPKWFIPLENLSKGNFVVAKHNDFYLIMDKNTNRVYFLR